MIFSKIVGGPDFNDISQFETVLHDVSLKYARFSASQSGLSKVQVVNYLNRKDKFESNEYGRGSYEIDGGYWEYYREKFLYKPFPAGYFSFKLYLTKKDPHISSKAYLESYLKDYIAEKNEGLDDPSHLNFVTFPVLKNTKVSNVDAIHYQLHGVPSRFHNNVYYVIPINSEYMINLDIIYRSCHGQSWTKIVDDLNEEATKTIVDSLELVQSLPRTSRE